MKTASSSIESIAETLTPIVHMNGDAAETLEKNWHDFARQMREIKLPEVHGRNYYVKEEGIEPSRKAMDEIALLLNEVSEIAIQVYHNIQD